MGLLAIKSALVFDLMQNTKKYKPLKFAFSKSLITHLLDIGGLCTTVYN